MSVRFATQRLRVTVKYPFVKPDPVILTLLFCYLLQHWIMAPCRNLGAQVFAQCTKVIASRTDKDGKWLHGGG